MLRPSTVVDQVSSQGDATQGEGQRERTLTEHLADGCLAIPLNLAWRLSIPERTTFPSNSPANASISISLSLAKLALQANKPDVAAQKYNEVLKLAWWSWEAYEGLCLLGERIYKLREDADRRAT